MTASPSSVSRCCPPHPRGPRRTGPRRRAQGRAARIQASQVPLHRPRRRRPRGRAPAACPAIRSPTTPPSPPAASGSPPTAASPGSRSSTTSPISTIGSHRRRAVRPQRDLRRQRRGQHPRQRRGRQRHLQVDRRRQDLEARLEAGRPDRHDDRPSAQIRISPMRRCSATPSAPTRSAASIAPPTAARRGSACSSRTRTPAPPTCASTRPTRKVLFAGLWQARRRPWELTSGGPGSGLYISRDGGDTWTQLVRRPSRTRPTPTRSRRPGKKYCEGLPEGIWGKVCVAVAPSDGRRVYALIEAEKGGLFRSDDGGDTWDLRQRQPRAAAAGLVLLDADRPPEEPRHGLVPAGAAAQEHRRRQDAAARQGAAPRRPPRHLDRPEKPRPHHRQQRRRRGHQHQRRRDVVRAAVADRPVLSRRRRQPHAVLRLRLHAGHRLGGGAEQQPARRAASACADWYRRRRRRGRLHGPRPDRPEHRLRRRIRRLHLALRPPHAPGRERQHLSLRPVRPRRRGPALPLPVDGPAR